MAASAVESLLSGLRRRPQVLPDTNLLLLWLVTLFDELWVPRFKRTQQFTTADGRMSVRVLAQFPQVLNTPHVLAETSNLAGQLPDVVKQDCLRSLRQRVTMLDEHFVRAADAVNEADFPSLGLTDAGVLRLLGERTLLLSDDYRLVQIAGAGGFHAINFNHLRRFG